MTTQDKTMSAPTDAETPTVQQDSTSYADADADADPDEAVVVAVATKEGEETLAVDNKKELNDIKSGTTNTKANDDDDDGNVGVAQDAIRLNGFWENQSKRMARNPCTHLCTSLILGILLSVIAMIVGEFSVSANTGGWQSRGTLIADRQTQQMLTEFNAADMLKNGDAVWDQLINNVQSGWEDDDDDGNTSGRRKMNEKATNNGLIPNAVAENVSDLFHPKADRILSLDGSSNSQKYRKLPLDINDNFQRRLENVGKEGVLQGCDLDYYTPEVILGDTRLWPVWKTTSSSDTAIDPQVILDICLAEENTQRILEEEGLCIPCGDTGRCLPPFSVVFYARLSIDNGMSMTCQELSDAWTPFQQQTVDDWKACVTVLRQTYDPNDVFLPSDCPYGFWPSMVEETFDETSLSRYTSSIFATDSTHVDDMYLIVDRFDRSDDRKVSGAYDTQWEDFVNQYTDESLTRDMTLALGSAIIVTLAIVIHTKSPFLSLIGLVQIVLSFPLSFFVYKLLIGLNFFPFLNFIGIFVVFALGAGDVFVAVDKWKNTRLENPGASVEYIAAVAFPDAAAAMFLTTLTTAVAFFATAICPVAPIKMFAIFCGLLIIFDYVMNVLLVFPALCIYDNALSAKGGHRNVNCCISTTCCGMIKLSGYEGQDGEVTASNKLDKTTDMGDHVGINVEHGQDYDEEEGEKKGQTDTKKKNEEEGANMIQRILLNFYDILHLTRWPLLALCLGALALSTYFASTLELPTSSDVRLLNENIEYEQNYIYRQKLLSNALDKQGGSQAYVMWGVKAADTGDLNDPGSWSQLVLDKSFDPSPKEAQVYLYDFCENIFDEDFADVIDANYTCPLTGFSMWLNDQSQLNQDEQDNIYQEKCSGASSIPMAQESFDDCIIAWARSVDEASILPYQGKVQIMFFPFTSRVRFDAFYDILDDEWHLIEKYMKEANKVAPDGVEKGYFTSFDFWWYDTNGQMLQTAYSAAGIALGCAAAVILFSSRSFVLTIFSTLTISYVLTSVTATLVAMGWTLGFLESICFAILIGVSVDFVIHFSHAYTIPPGNTDRGTRTKYALVTMGPSILATALTTVLSAIVMLFTVITFFQKFALILFFTVIQATAGSFIVLLVMVDCIGPSDPTYLVDKVLFRRKSEEAEESNEPTEA